MLKTTLLPLSQKYRKALTFGEEDLRLVLIASFGCLVDKLFLGCKLCCLSIWFAVHQANGPWSAKPPYSSRSLMAMRDVKEVIPVLARGSGQEELAHIRGQGQRPRVPDCDGAGTQTAAHQAPPSLEFSRQEHWSGLPFFSPIHERVFLFSVAW